jgi:cyanate permease
MAEKNIGIASGVSTIAGAIVGLLIPVVIRRRDPQES